MGCVAKPKPPWMNLTDKDLATIDFDHLPPDEGIVAPIAAADDEPEDFVRQQIETLREKLPAWPPADDEPDRARVEHVSNYRLPLHSSKRTTSA